MMEIRVTRGGGVDLVDVSGEVDVSNVQELDDAITRALSDDTTSCLVDLSAVSLLDSSVVHELLRWQADAQLSEREALAIATGENTAAVRILTLAGVIGMLPIFRSREAAGTALREGQRARSQRRLRWLTDAELATARTHAQSASDAATERLQDITTRKTAEAPQSPRGTGLTTGSRVVLEERFDAVPELVPVARQAVRDAIADFALSSGLEADIALAVTEAVANAVRHAYPDRDDGTVDLTVSRAPATITISVVDDDHDLRRRHRRLVSPRDSAPLSLGLRLIEQLADDCDVTTSPTGTTITMRFPTTAGIPAAPHPDSVYGA